MKKLFTTLFLTMLSIQLSAQQTVTGTVTDTQNNTPLADITIYFPQLEKGALTDENGRFSISNLPLGNFKIIASLLGYTTYTVTMTIKEGLNTLDIALAPSAIEMEEVIISTPFHMLQSENVMKVERASLKELKTKGAITLADGITTIAGVESVTTGIGIGKPVIRGLSSNRVVVYTQGIRLENQQYGDEHGLGVNEAGIESIEVIKGPASLLYGSDALGGVLYLNPENFEIAGKSSSDNNLSYFSNTQGFQGNAGFKASGEHFRFLIRGAVASHIDYRTGNDQRLTNSRFREYDIKTGIGYQDTRFKTELRYNFNKSELGIPEEIAVQSEVRSPELPFQDIENHILSSKTSLFLNDSSLDLTLGYILNNRKEFEDSEDTPALFMELQTLNYALQYNLPQLGKFETIIGLQGMNQANENFGEEVLIPNATTNDVGLLVTSHFHLNDRHDFQFGIRYDNRTISSEQNSIIGQADYIAAIDTDFNSFNSAFGYKINMNPKLVGRLNLASGFRAPNLAELTSNGVHEGTNRFEIGNPNLKNESNFQIDLALEYKDEHVEFFINAFLNKVTDFIFIEPNGDFVGTDPVYLYAQEDAELYGGEIGFHLHPHPLDWLHIESTFESVTAKQDNGEYLPLIPANSLTNTVRVELNKNESWLHDKYAFITLKSVFKQDNTAEFETATNGYSLLNAGIGGQIISRKSNIDVRITANNILDKSYISHLSRLKPDGIPNIGRNIQLGVSIPL